MSASVSIKAAKPARSAQEVRRIIGSNIGWVACGFALLCVIGPLVDIVAVIAIHGLSAFSGKLFTTVTNGTGGGLLNAIEGTAVLSLGAMIIAVPIGVGAGIYLSEYGQNRLGSTIRFLSDVLTGTPSIVLGYFSYIVFIISLGWGFSVLAGAITLGETAPLIYTAGWSNYTWDGKLTHAPIGYLTYVIWSFIDQPFAESHALAFAAAFLVMLVVLAINVGVRLVVKRA
jgi:ABC-type phosphate transport system permease subunit